MLCGKCGRTIEDNSKFCTGCGTAMGRKKLCPLCEHVDRDDGVYCAQCGTLLKAVKLCGAKLLTVSRISLYEGTPKMGIAKGTGDLHVRDDRVEFVNHFGDAMGDVFDAVGMNTSAQKAKRNLQWSFPMKQIKSVHEGKYAGVFSSIVITMKDGRTYSFSGTVSNDTIRSALTLIQRYIRFYA